jgi:hypothetical protein
MSGPSSSRAGLAGREEFVSAEHVSVGPVSTFLLDLLVSQYPGWLCHGGFKSLERKCQGRFILRLGLTRVPPTSRGGTCPVAVRRR